MTSTVITVYLFQSTTGNPRDVSSVDSSSRNGGTDSGEQHLQQQLASDPTIAGIGNLPPQQFPSPSAPLPTSAPSSGRPLSFSGAPTTSETMADTLPQTRSSSFTGATPPVHWSYQGQAQVQAAPSTVPPSSAQPPVTMMTSPESNRPSEARRDVSFHESRSAEVPPPGQEFRRCSVAGGGSGAYEPPVSTVGHLPSPVLPVTSSFAATAPTGPSGTLTSMGGPSPSLGGPSSTPSDDMLPPGPAHRSTSFCLGSGGGGGGQLRPQVPGLTERRASHPEVLAVEGRETMWVLV